MAGGKETPRQKMIGMMYLVLTALLALNVSKSILDAFVAIEENMQKVNIVQANRGDLFIKDVKAELASSNAADQALKRKKLNYVLKKMRAIDNETAEIIKFIDGLKLEILKESGENVSQFSFQNPKSILWKKQEAVTPMRTWLAAVQAMDKYDEPMRVMGISDDIKNPKGNGKELWKRYNDFRTFIINSAGTYQIPGSDKGFQIEVDPINDYVDNDHLTRKVNKMIEASKANFRDDKQVLVDLYLMLTKKERNVVHDQSGVHWIGMTFDHSPVVAAIASLSSMQQEILAARAMALGSYKSKVTVGDFSFNRIVGLAYGPAFANAGEEVDVSVMMAAFDSDNNPTVTYNGNTFLGENGQGKIKVKASGSEMTLSGTISIKNKSGIPKTEKWEHKIKIMKPAGAISLPEFNVLYRGYDNKISAVASGFDQTQLSATAGTTLTKQGDLWIASPGSGRETTLTVSGTNSVTGKSQVLLAQKFKVLSMPSPELFWGGVANGNKAPNATHLMAKYGPGIPLNAEFQIVRWECTVGSYPGPPIVGTGTDVSKAMSIIKSAKTGMTVTFNATVINPREKVERKILSQYKI